MTIPQDAVEAAAIIVSGDTEKWFYEYPTSDSDRAGYRAKAHKAITAALPALERQIRRQVAQEVLDNHRLYECHEEDPQSDNHPRACVWEIAQSAAEDVLGREQA